MRKAPQQLRSKERVERILDATEALVIEDGVASLTVNSIAARAEVPIGSLYQYFTNRDEVLRALCDRHYAGLRGDSAECFVDISNVSDFTRDVRRALQLCWDYTRDNAGYRQLFFDVQAWEIMREADWQDTFVNAKRMSQALQKLAPYADPKSILALCVIIGDSASGIARVAVRFDDLRDELFFEFIEMVESRIYTLLRDNAALERSAAKDGRAQPLDAAS